MDWFIKLHAHTIKENIREWVNIQICILYIYVHGVVLKYTFKNV